MYEPMPLTLELTLALANMAASRVRFRGGRDFHLSGLHSPVSLLYYFYPQWGQICFPPQSDDV